LRSFQTQSNTLLPGFSFCCFIYEVYIDPSFGCLRFVAIDWNNAILSGNVAVACGCEFESLRELIVCLV